METKDTTAVNTAQPAATEKEVIATTPVTEVDAEAKIAELETEKAKLVEESANWKLAALKYKKERKEPEFIDDSQERQEESDEDRVRRITREELANSRIAQIDSEKDALLKKALAQVKELKLANANKGAVPVSVGTHSEGQAVKDTLITPEQLKAFQARGWSEKDIERYKKNLQKYGGR